MPHAKTKICGLSDAISLEAAIAAGAAYIGFVFFEPSPRHIGYRQARILGDLVAGRAQKVALTVDADNARLDEIQNSLAPDWWQLHGEETPDRVAQIKARYGRPAIKAIKIRDTTDLHQIDNYCDVADLLLFDAKMPDDAEDALPGGNGVSFDWSLVGKYTRGIPFMLSGGLTAGNVARAISILHPAIVDVSSGVESAPGKKDTDRIKQFIDAVKAANRQEDAA